MKFNICLQFSTDGSADPNLINDYIFALKPIFDQKMPLVCYRTGSDEIVGLNWTFVECKGDNFAKQFYPNVKKAEPAQIIYFVIQNLQLMKNLLNLS